MIEYFCIAGHNCFLNSGNFQKPAAKDDMLPMSEEYGGGLFAVLQNYFVVLSVELEKSVERCPIFASFGFSTS